jgi:D-beta-D-heptose 7-phosphate kinase/D-beta-D-heptose 1-phosphate adenosyltransferase
MVKLSNAFGHLRPFKALVLGDFMLDTYTTGRVKRISPEAPVPVMEVLKQESRPGGAGNVVLNILSLGGQVIAMGRIGNDAEGRTLRDLLTQHQAETNHLWVEPHYKTPVKNRLIADSQQIIRVDFETVSSLPYDLEQQVIETLQRVIPQVKVIALSDYGKGFLTNSLLSACLQMAKKHGVPTIVDPKGIDFAKYRGATILKPNLSEAFAAAKMPPTAPLQEVAQRLLEISSAELLLITRSEAGISLFDAAGGRTDFPVRSREVKDVTGAGDTVLALVSLGMANGIGIQHSVQLANIAAGIAIERLGCAQITLSQLARRLLEYDCQTKVFDESDSYALHQVLQGKRYFLLVLNRGQEMTSGLFHSIRKLSGLDGHELIVYAREAHPEDELIHLLASLHEVNYIILHAGSLKSLCEMIHPYEVYVLEENRISQAKDLLSSLITPPPKHLSLS